MSLNAKPKILFNNVFALGIPTATDTDSDSQYNPLNVADWRYNTLWKAASTGEKFIRIDLNIVLNAGFETGDFTNWDQNNASISGDQHSGLWSSTLVATGSNQSGPRSDAYDVDVTKTYIASGWSKITAYTAGTYRFRIIFLDSTETIISPSIDLLTLTALQSSWLYTEKSIGPVGSGADIEFPAGTKYVQFDDRLEDTPTATAFIDDVLFYENVTVDSLVIANHNLWSTGASIRVQESHSQGESAAVWSYISSAFSPTNDKAFIDDSITPTSGSRGYAIQITTSNNVIPYVGMAWLGDIFTFEKYALGPFDPDPETQKSETTKSMAGYPLGTIIDYYTRQINVNFRLLSPSWVSDTFSTLWTHLRQGLPVVWIWDITNHSDEIYIGSLPPNFKRSMPYTPVIRTLNLKLDTIVEED